MADDPSGAAPGTSSDPNQWPTGRLISAAARRMEHAWNTYLSRWHLNHASLPALIYLMGGPTSQRDLAARLGVTEQTTSRIIDGLERSGYVVRQADPDDARRRLLLATDAGRIALRELNRAGPIEALVDHGLSEDEEATLRRLLIRFLT